MLALPKRLLSIDVFRAVTMLLMIFVNDADGVQNLPGWLKHVKADEDGLGFADVIFPAFLFIVGLSLPFAVKNRMAKSNSSISISYYIFGRSLALIIMGFFHVNAENYSSEAILPRPFWLILVTLSFFLIWLDYPDKMSKVRISVFRTLGVVMLIAMALLYRGGDAGNTEGMKPHWWGILGIIGWAYLVCAGMFLLFRGRLAAVTATFIIFFLINLLSHLNLLPFSFSLIGDASSHTLIMAGVLISAIYSELLKAENTKRLWPVLLFFGAGLVLYGMLIRPLTGGISKINSTPSWVGICSGISILTFAFFIYLVDVGKKISWFNPIKPAGTNTLTCYLIPYILYALFEIFNFNYPEVFNAGLPGIGRSFAVAGLVIAVAGALEKLHIRLKV